MTTTPDQSGFSAEAIRRALRTPMTWVVMVGVVSFLVQIVLFDPSRFYEWDEAVYVAEVSRSADPVLFGVQRARGTTFVAAPVAVLTSSVTVLRLYLAAVTSLGLVAAFATWTKTVRWVAPIAAGLFAFMWPALLYGSELSPNLYTALLAVAALGFAGRWALSGELRPALALASMLALAAFVRPSDALFVLIASIAMVLIVQPQTIRSPNTLLPMAGFAVGLLPWLLEAWVRYGGPVERYRAASRQIGGELRSNVVEYLRLADGPLLGPDPGSVIPTGALGWFVVVLVLGVLGPIVTDGERRRIALGALAGAGLLAAPYVFYTTAAAPRFLLPALAALSISAAFGVRAAFARTAIAWVVMAVLVVALPAQIATAMDAEQARRSSAAEALAVGERLADLAGDQTCHFWSRFARPQIAVASGCRQHPPSATTVDDVYRVIGRGEFGAVVYVGEPEAAYIDWERVVAAGGGSREWVIAYPGDGG